MAKNIVEYILDIKTNAAEKNLKDVSKAANKAERELKDVDKSARMENAKKGLKGLAVGLGVATAATVAMAFALKTAATALKDLTIEVVDSVNRLNDLTTRSGVAASSIQALSLAFQASGQEAGKADSLISKFPEVYTQLSEEGSKAAEAAEGLGVSLRKQDKSMKDSNTLLLDLIKGLQQVPDDATRASEAFKIFGGEAGDLMQALGNSAPLESFLRLTDQFGVKVGEEASAAAAELQIKLALLDTVVQGLKQSIVQAGGGVDHFNKLLTNAIVVSVGIQEMIHNNQEAFETFGSGLANLAAGFFGVLSSMFTEFGSIINIATTMIGDNIRNIAVMLYTVGAISDTTYADLIQMSTGLKQIGKGSEQIGEGVESYEFGSTKSGQEALNDLNALLKGANRATSQGIPSLKDYKEAIEDTNEAAAAGGSKSGPSAEEIFAAIEKDFVDFLSSTDKSFENIGLSQRQIEIKNLENTITKLTDAALFFEEFGMNDQLEKALELRTIAESELTRVLNEGVEAVEETTMAFSDLFQGLANAVSNIQDPSSLLGSLPAFLESLPQIFDLVTQKALAASDRYAQLAFEGGNQAALFQRYATATGGVGAAASSNAGLAASAAAAAPYVGAFASIVTAIAQLGGTTTQEIDDKFDTFIRDLEKGLEILPKIITNVLPEFIIQLTKMLNVDFARLIVFDLPVALIQGFLMLFPHLINEMVLLIADIFKGVVNIVDGIKNFIGIISTKEGWQKIGDSIVQAIKDQLSFSRGFLKDAFSMRSGGRYIPSARGGIRFTGANEGMAMLHRGEFVVPESNVAPQAVDRRLRSELGGGGMNVIINADIVEGSAIDELVRKIEERFGTFGASTSTLFGGV